VKGREEKEREEGREVKGGEEKEREEGREGKVSV
jgi:hypothetical protein